MVADDVSYLRQTIAAILRNGGYQVVGEARTGREAVELYESLKPQLVVMDIAMPGMNGIEALAEMRARDPKARVIMCSALARRNLVMECWDRGALDFVSKPVNHSRLLEAVARALERDPRRSSDHV